MRFPPSEVVVSMMGSNAVAVYLLLRSQHDDEHCYDDQCNDCEWREVLVEDMEHSGLLVANLTVSRIAYLAGLRRIEVREALGRLEDCGWLRKVVTEAGPVYQLGFLEESKKAKSSKQVFLADVILMEWLDRRWSLDRIHTSPGQKPARKASRNKPNAKVKVAPTERKPPRGDL